MILKLTFQQDGCPCLVDTCGLLIAAESDGARLYQSRYQSDHFFVKETIEEIEQQIKDRGICGQK